MSFSKMAVAIKQVHGVKPFSRPPRCRLQSLTHLDYNFLKLQQENPANSNQSLREENMHRSFSTPCFPLASNMEDELETGNPQIEILGGQNVATIRRLVAEVTIAMAFGVEAVPLPGGLGGAYLLRIRNGHNVAVAKPIDEEHLAFNNPKGFGSLMLGQTGLRRSIRVGETGIRELAAFLLDHHGFAGVPPTALVKISRGPFHYGDTPLWTTTPHKIASLQRFVDHDFDAGELGSSGFSVASVHRIGILDVRVLNLDRHAGNMLVKRQSQNQGRDSVGMAELVPIDHSLCLPEVIDDPYFEWLHWPQALVPFSDSELQYISHLDPFRDAELLRSELPSLGESSIRLLILCTIFLKEAAAAGVCLADIGQMMTREFSGGNENLSVLEELCTKAKANVVSLSDDDSERYTESGEEREMDYNMFWFDGEQFEDCQIEVDLPYIFPIHNDHLMEKISNAVPRCLPLGTTTAKVLNAILPPSSKKTVEQKDLRMGKEDDEINPCSKTGCLTRSHSHLMQDSTSHETRGISFGDITEAEWLLVLESFKSLLPEVMESTKYRGLKQRLGTPSQF